MKKTVLVFLMAFMCIAKSFAYDRVVFKNYTTKAVDVEVYYLACKNDKFSVAAGATGSPSANRGACLITSVSATGATSYTSSGTSFSLFCVMEINGKIEVHRMNADGTNADQSSGYLNVFFTNNTNNKVDVEVNYYGGASCTKDKFSVAAGATGSPTTNRGLCLITSISASGATSYTSSGTTYSRFALIKHNNGLLHVHLTDNAGIPQDITAVCGVAASTTVTKRFQIYSNELPFLWNGNSYNKSGIFPILLKNREGGDSTVQLVLTVKEPIYKWRDKDCDAAMQRWKAVGFKIGNKMYIGTGFAGGSSYKNDFWEYDPSIDKWTQKKSVPGLARQGAVGFSINGKGYIGFGVSYPNSLINDFWEYDPSTDNWTSKAVPSSTYYRQDATGFNIGNKGYMACGDDMKANTDFWEYDPSNNSWSKKAPLPGKERKNAVGFSIDTKGYIGTGSYVNANVETYLNDFWEYNPSNDTWNKKADFPGGNRSYATGFSIVDKGYIGSGHNGAETKTDFYAFIPSANAWKQCKDLNYSRASAVGFSIDYKGYISSGFKIGVTKALSYERQISIYEPTGSPIIIASQQWMANNLDVFTYRNGDSIPQVTDPKKWDTLTTGAWCYYDNDTINSSNCIKYGKLYNWFAVNDPRGLAPQGWHIPSNAEWTTLETNLGGSLNAGAKMKEPGTLNWASPNNTGDFKSCGWDGMPGGMRMVNVGFIDKNKSSNWWSSNQYNANSAHYRNLYYDAKFVKSWDQPKQYGAYVRCIKD